MRESTPRPADDSQCLRQKRKCACMNHPERRAASSNFRYGQLDCALRWHLQHIAMQHEEDSVVHVLNTIMGYYRKIIPRRRHGQGAGAFLGKYTSLAKHPMLNCNPVALHSSASQCQHSGTFFPWHICWPYVRPMGRIFGKLGKDLYNLKEKTRLFLGCFSVQGNL